MSAQTSSEKPDDWVLVATCDFLDSKTNEDLAGLPDDIIAALQKHGIDSDFEVTVGILAIIVKTENKTEAETILKNSGLAQALGMQFY